MSSSYLRLLIFLLEILIPVYASSSPVFSMMYSAYKLNKQGDNIQPWHTPFPIWNQSIVPCPILTVASWPAYRLLRRQVRWSGIPISFRISQFVVIHTDKGFSIANEAKVDIFLEFSCLHSGTSLWNQTIKCPSIPSFLSPHCLLSLALFFLLLPFTDYHCCYCC